MVNLYSTGRLKRTLNPKLAASSVVFIPTFVFSASEGCGVMELSSKLLLRECSSLVDNGLVMSLRLIIC